MNNQKVAMLIVVIILTMSFLACGPGEPEILGGIGEEVIIGDMGVTVNYIEQIQSYHSEPSEGNMYVGVHLTIKNNSSEEKEIETLIMTMLGLKDNRNKTYRPNSDARKAPGNENLLPDSVPAGESISGYLGYEVPSNVSNLIFIFKDSPRGASSAGSIFLAESMAAVIESGNASETLGKTCRKFANSPVSEESTTGTLQFVDISNLGSEPYTLTDIDIEGYATSPTNVETLVCVFYRSDTIETCEYEINTSFTVKMDRVVISKNVLLVNLAEEKVVRQKTFEGGQPPECPDTVEVEENKPALPDKNGFIPTDKQVLEWVQEYWTP